MILAFSNSTAKWDHVVFVVPRLTYCTDPRGPSVCKRQDLLTCGRVILRRVHLNHTLIPLAVAGRLARPQIWALVDRAAVTTGVQASF